MKEQDLGTRWFNTTFYPKNRTNRAARYEDGVLPRLRQEKITFFTPWGPRYSWEKKGWEIQTKDKEAEVIEMFAGFQKEFERNMPGKSFSWIFLGADLYGTKINNLSAEGVRSYFQNLEAWLCEKIPSAQLILWSSFDGEAENYRRLIRENFGEFVDPHLLERATNTARGMKRGGDPREYLVERIAEAMLIEEKFHPIKISCVGRHKDVKVDWNLPRLYLLPEELQAPWM